MRPCKTLTTRLSQGAAMLLLCTGLAQAQAPLQSPAPPAQAAVTPAATPPEPAAAPAPPVIKRVPVQADAYYPPTLERMIDFMFANGFVDPNEPQQLIDYVRVKDCGLFKAHYYDDFTWNKIKNRIIQETKILQKDTATRFVVSDSLDIERYNFDTQAFDINPRNQMRNINSLNVLSVDVNQVCDTVRGAYGEKALSFEYDVRLDTPLSLYRIPMASSMARYILPELSERNKRGLQKRKIYTLIYFTVDGVMATTKSSTLLGGRVDKIEFFLDPQRTQRFKRLVYTTL